MKVRIWHNWMVVIIGAIIVSFVASAEVEDTFKHLDIRSVKVGGEIGRRINITIYNNLLKMDIDGKYMPDFKNKSRSGGYIGMGKFVDTAVRFAAYTNDPCVIDFKNHIIDELIQTQESDGYIGIVKPQNRMWHVWDIHEMSYMILGLSSDLEYFHSEKSLQAAKNLADYIINCWAAEPNRTTYGPETIFVTTTGLEEAMMKLYMRSKDKKYLDFVVDFRKLPEWQKGIDIGSWGGCEGHVSHYISRCVAQLYLYHFQPEKRLLNPTCTMMDFLLKQNGLMVPGYTSHHECWSNNQFGKELTSETCATAYLVRMLDNLLLLEGDSIYGDIMERSMYNGLFAAQAPDGWGLRYYTPFEGPRVYRRDNMFCCPNNYRRIVSELPYMIYYQTKKGIAVNLYTPSSAQFLIDKDIPVKISQETDYPNTGKIKISVEPAAQAEFELQLRLPRWCKKPQLVIDSGGEKTSVKLANSGCFAQIKRTWKSGDKVELNFPMSWRFIKGRKAQAGRVAVMRGPVLFCFNPEYNPADSRLFSYNPKVEPESIDAGRLSLALSLVKIDINSIQGPEPDNTVRPDGMACRIKAWPVRNFNLEPAPLEFKLTEFTDPNGLATYFLVPNPNIAGIIDDELVQNAKNCD